MIISDKHKLVFIHIQKTGGASIKQWINNNGGGREVHWYHSPIFKEDAEKYKDYLKFVVVRNSWEICASCYRFECKGVDPRPSMKKNLSFREWLIEKEANQNQNHAPFPHQLKFITDERGNILVDKIIQYPDIDQEIKKISDELGMKYTLKKTAHYYGDYDWKTFYNDDDYNFVAEMCKDDIEYFGW